MLLLWFADFMKSTIRAARKSSIEAMCQGQSQGHIEGRIRDTLTLFDCACSNCRPL